MVDASECPPTFGVPFDLVVGIIAGGDKAIRRAVENAEDDAEQAWIDLQQFDINENDVVIGIAASGTTPYVIGGLKACNEKQISTGSISCNAGSPLSQTAKFPIEVIVGSRICNRKFENESRYRSKISSQYDFDSYYDSARQSKRQQNGRYAIEQRQIGRPWR